VDSLRGIQSDTSQALVLLQQAHDETKKGTAVNAADIAEIKKNQNMVRGGWLALCVIGAAIVGLATVVGALAAVLVIKFR